MLWVTLVLVSLLPREHAAFKRCEKSVLQETAGGICKLLSVLAAACNPAAAFHSLSSRRQFRSRRALRAQHDAVTLMRFLDKKELLRVVERADEGKGAPIVFPVLSRSPCKPHMGLTQNELDDLMDETPQEPKPMFPASKPMPKEAEPFPPKILRSQGSFNLDLVAHVKGGRWKAALDLFQEMLAQGVEPDVSSFNAAISASLKGGLWELSLGLFQSMERVQARPNGLTYSAAVVACEKGQQWQRGLQFIDEMGDMGVELSVVCLNSAIAVCGRSEEWGRALELLNQLIRRGLDPNIVSFNEVMLSCERNNQWSRVIELLRDMDDVHVQPDVQSYAAVVSVCARNGDWRSAMFYFDEMRRANWTPDRKGYKSAMAALMLNKEYEHVKYMFEEMAMHDITGDEESYAQVLNACDATMDWVKSLQLLQDMIQHNVQPKITTLHRAMSTMDRQNAKEPQLYPTGQIYKGLIHDTFVKKPYVPEPTTNKIKYQQGFKTEIERLRQKRSIPESMLP